MHVSHSLVPAAVGRYSARRGGALFSAKSGQKPSPSLATTSDSSCGRVYEGELVGRSVSHDSTSWNSYTRYNTRQAYWSQAGDSLHLSRADAIRTYINNAGLTGVNRPLFGYSLDTYA